MFGIQSFLRRHSQSLVRKLRSQPSVWLSHLSISSSLLPSLSVCLCLSGRGMANVWPLSVQIIRYGEILSKTFFSTFGMLRGRRWFAGAVLIPSPPKVKVQKTWICNFSGTMEMGWEMMWVQLSDELSAVCCEIHMQRLYNISACSITLCLVPVLGRKDVNTKQIPLLYDFLILLEMILCKDWGVIVF